MSAPDGYIFAGDEGFEDIPYARHAEGLQKVRTEMVRRHELDLEACAKERGALQKEIADLKWAFARSQKITMFMENSTPAEWARYEEIQDSVEEWETA